MDGQSQILAFGFVAPAVAAAGLLAIAIPIAIHLLNRRRYRVMDWAAMQFLLAAMRKNRRRLRFEQWLLLATRCALVALAGLALARPMACDNSSLANLAGQTSELHVIVIDNSYSMAYRADRPDALTHFDQAKKLAHALVDRMSAGNDAVVLISAAAPATAIISKPSYDLTAVTAAIDRLEQSYSGTDLAGALTLAQQAGTDDTDHTVRNLGIISDSTVSAWHDGHESQLEALGPKLASLFQIRHFSLAMPNQSNAAMLDVGPASNLVRTRFSNDFRAVPKAFGATVDSSILWKLADETLPGGSSISIDAQTQPITQSNIQLRAGGATVISAQIATEDRLPLDNIRYRTIDVANELKVLVVEGRRGMGALDGSGVFLELALAPPPLESLPGKSTASYIKPERISDIELAGRVLGDYRAIMLTDVAQIAAPVADQLAAYVNAGGTLVWFMGEQVSREAYNNVLVSRGLLPGPLTQRQTGAGFNFDFNPTANNHPLLQAFGNIDKSGLDTAQVFTYWQIQPREDLKVERVLDFRAAGTKDPAITVHSLGAGRVVFMATSADAEWTGFPAKPAYVALIHEIVAGTVAGSDRWMNLQVGDAVELPPTLQLGGVPSLVDPISQQAQPLNQAAKPDGVQVYRSKPIAKPGVYRLAAGTISLPISVNIPASEADVRTISESAIRTALGNAEIQTLGFELPAIAVADTGRDFGWSLMVIVLVLLGCECFLAMRFGHYKRS